MYEKLALISKNEKKNIAFTHQLNQLSQLDRY